MKDKRIEIVRGSGNVFRDSGYENADLEQLRAILAAQIINCSTNSASPFALHRRKLASPPPIFPGFGMPISRFTIDRLMTIINRLGPQVDVTVKVRLAAKSTSKKRKAA